MKWLRVLTFPILAVAVTASVAQAQTRAEETASTATNYNGTASISYTGNWNQGSTVRAFSGATAAYSAAPGARMTLTFSGTGASWIGFRGPQTGVARVFVDDVQEAEVDTYAPTEEVRVPLFGRGGLVAGPHTLAIEVAGIKNPLSTDFFVVVDAFDIDGTPAGRIQETGSAAIEFTGNWNQGSTVRAFSGATAAYSNASAARATLTFRGTGVRWISAQGPQTGIANVYVDGVSVATVDTYSPTEQMQVPLFTSSALAAGIHTVTIEVTGNKNPASTDALVVVDAFDVTP